MGHGNHILLAREILEKLKMVAIHVQDLMEVQGTELQRQEEVMEVEQNQQVGEAIIFLETEERNKALEEIGVEALKTEMEEETGKVAVEIEMEDREDIKEILEVAQEVMTILEVETQVLEDRIEMSS